MLRDGLNMCTWRNREACGSVLHCSWFMAVIPLASLKYPFAFDIVNLSCLT